MNQIFAQQQTTQELRDQIRQTVREQVRTSEGQGSNIVISKDGKVLTITNSGEAIPAGTTAIPVRDFVKDLDVPPRAQNVAFAFFFTLAAIIIFTPIARALARFIDRRGNQPQIPAQVTAQLTQLTQAVDSIAIEVERISEGQRFTTKLLAEQQKAAKTLPSS